MRFLFLEPFYGGSHKDFADGLKAYSYHDIILKTLPDQFWKWRIRTSGIWFAQNIIPSDYDGIITNNMLSVAQLQMIWGDMCPPVFLYNHESQISYPVPRGQKLDFEFIMTEITNSIAAKCIAFNSLSHYHNFFRELSNILQRFPEPEYIPSDLEKKLRDKSIVLYPGCHFPFEMEIRKHKNKAPLIIWNHRWSFDKRPEVFEKVLSFIQEENLKFRLAILGDTHQVKPKGLKPFLEKYKSHIIHYGYVPIKQGYYDFLGEGSLVISVAIQENFGISIVEAVRYGAIPLLPRRLSYPEILENKFHKLCIYNNIGELTSKLKGFLSDDISYDFRKDLSLSMAKYAWENVIAEYDRVLEEMVVEK